MKILASHQPDFFPYMGYFYKIFQSDIFVFSDDVQYSKSGMHNYNEILTRNGPMKYTLPIHYHVANLNEVQIAADDKRISKMLKTLWMEYRKSDFFDTVFPIMENLLYKAAHVNNLAEFNQICIIEFAERLGLVDGRRLLISSDLCLKSRRDARIIEMCKLLGADAYYSGTGAKDYHIEDDYRANSIELIYSDYEPLIYKQNGGVSATNMSVIDYVMNCGFSLPKEWSRNG